jgi:hypothetical protein
MVDLIFEQPDVDFGRNFSALAERDIDFLLLEEFQVNEDFVHWFCMEIGLLDITPGGAWHSIFDADGETDLLIRVHAGEKRIGILLENKVAAAEQPGQAERYHIRGGRLVEQGKLSEYRTVMCAPEIYLKNRENLGDNAYGYTISYETISAWFGAQKNRRADWRAHVIQEAVAQSRRGYTMVVDPQITVFQEKYWSYLQKQHPKIFMVKPGNRGPNSTWIVMRGQNFSKHVRLNHKINVNSMELSFSGTDVADLRALRPEWPDDVIVTQKGKSATISLIVPEIDPRSDFDSQVVAIETAFKAAERLLQYATILEKPAASTTNSTAESEGKVDFRDVQQLSALAKFLPAFEDKNFKFGELRCAAAGQMGFFCYSTMAEDFIKTVNDAGWIRDMFPWMDWQNSQEATRLNDEPDFLAQADVEQLTKLLTTLIRRDRFNEGELAIAYDDGLLTRIIRRATALLNLQEAEA